MESVFLVTAIVGVIELIKALNTNDFVTAEIIFSAALIGAICGVWQVDHLTIVTGIQGGLSAAGVYKVGKLVGGASQ